MIAGGAASMRWLQTNVHLNEGADAEQMCADLLGPQMQAAVEDGVLAGWFFIRKSPWWRLRYAPVPQVGDPLAHERVHDALTTLEATKYVGELTQQVYEPEIAAFGGAEAMNIAHRLFAADSQHIAAYLAEVTRCPKADRRRELALLLPVAQMRAAGQEWFELGDIWAQVAALRGSTPIVPSRPNPTAQVVRRFLSIAPETAALRLADPIAKLTTRWLAEHRAAGIALRALADKGRLERGLRSVLTHHILFEWNRLGLSINDQQRLARAARDAVFAEPQSANTPSPAS
jgi:thiopeptide-type bacteriocin biosynthesis protein